jgi:hypothetical protein
MAPHVTEIINNFCKPPTEFTEILLTQVASYKLKYFRIDFMLIAILYFSRIYDLSY